MDLSKLPKLSDTKSQSVDTPVPAIEPVTPEPIHQAPAAPPQPAPIGDIWFGLIIGLLFVYLGGTFARYAIATVTHQPFHTGVNWAEGPKIGTEVSYFELQGFTAWSDMGIFFFGLVLLFDSVAKALVRINPGSVSRLILMSAVLLTAVAVLLNVIACTKMLSVQITPILSALAVAFGGWILFDQWQTLRRTVIASR